MAVEQKKILIRRGNKADLVLTDLQPGEQVLALDTNEVGIKTSGGDMIWYAHADDLAAHAARTDNPHSVSAAQIGAVLASEKGVANGVASLGKDGMVPAAQTGIASGSNSNGNYIKFPDGTLICYKGIDTYVAITNTWGSLYESVVVVKFGDWPAAFTGNPDAVAQVLTHGESDHLYALIESISGVTATLAGESFLLRPVSTAASKYYISVVTIGRWK
jgi:hypothetical protein